MQKILGVALLSLATACSSRASDGTATEGERSIREQLMPPVLNLIPSLKLEAVRCPATLHLADGHHDRCTVRLAGRDFTVDLWRDPQSGLVPLLLATPINVEALEVYRNDRSGDPRTTVDCGQPKTRLFSPGDVITCESKGSGGSHVWKMTVQNLRGSVTIPNGFPGQPDAKDDPLTAKLQPLLANPNRIVDGTDMEALIRSSFYRVPEHALGPVHCAPKLDLSDGRWQLCTALMSDQPVRIRVDVLDGSWEVRPDQAMVHVQDLETAAADSAANKMRAQNSAASAITVTCPDKGLLIRDYPVHLRCELRWNGTEHMPAHIYVDGSRPSQSYFYFGEPHGEQNEDVDGIGGSTAATTTPQHHFEAQSRAGAQPADALGVKYFWRGRSDRLNRGIAVVWFAMPSMAAASQSAQPLYKRYAAELARTDTELLLLKGISSGLLSTSATFVFRKDHNGDWSRNEDAALEKALLLAGY